MKIKKLLIFFPILLLFFGVVFYIGYRIGVKDGTISAIDPMLDIQKFLVASRTARIVSDLHDMKLNPLIDSKSVCDMKSIVLRQIEDWNSCKENESCKEKISSGYYAKTDEKISDFMNIACEN